MPRRLGVLGGSFNPPHRGHLAIASHALAQLGLERVLLMPSHTPPHKPSQHDPGPLHRLHMCELAVEGHAGLAACALEIERGGASYTVDTLLGLHARADANADADADVDADADADVDADARDPAPRLTLILGSDMARTLPAWRRPEEILRLAGIAVAERAGDGREEALAALAALGTLGARVDFLEMPAIDISSSMVRERVAQGEPVRELVGPAVAAYIAEQRLYRGQDGHPGGAPAR
jgi:nicotinate-nucleotide adenylyltransferase